MSIQNQLYIYEDKYKKYLFLSTFLLCLFSTVLTLFLEYSYNSNLIKSFKYSIQRHYLRNELREMRYQGKMLLDSGFSSVKVFNHSGVKEVFLLNQKKTIINIPIEFSFITNSELGLSNGKMIVSYGLGGIAMIPLVIVLGIIFCCSLFLYLYIPKKALKDATIKHIESKKKEIELYRNLAHDLRAPLELLNDNVNLDRIEDRELFYKILIRIKCMSNEILEKSNQNCLSLSENINQLLNEKINLIKNRKKEIQLNTEFNYCELNMNFSYTSELMRVLSNLIDNSIDSIEKNGKIMLTLKKIKNNRLFITIIDNGRGIPKEILKKLGKYELSHGKKNGNGLGVFNACKFLNLKRGKFNIQSKVGEGTIVKMDLPIL